MSEPLERLMKREEEPKNIANDNPNDSNDNNNNVLNEEMLKIDNEEEDEVDEESIDYPKGNNPNDIENNLTEDKNTDLVKETIKPASLSPLSKPSSEPDISNLEEDNEGISLRTEKSIKNIELEKNVNEADINDNSNNNDNDKVINQSDLKSKEYSSKQEPIIDKEAQEEEVLDEEEEGETRCICNELDPPDDSGLFIQCEQCGVWQHGYCVGIIKKDTPDKYWCEQCRPDLHRLYITDLGENRSLYKPVQGLRRQKKRLIRQSQTSKKNKTNRSKDLAETSSTTTDTSLSIDSPSPSTITSSVSKTSRKTDNSISSTISCSTRSSNKNKNKNVTTEDSKSDVRSNISTRSDNRSSINETDDDINDNGDNYDDNENTDSINQSSTSYNENDRRLQDRKRATFQAREEKQYQRMLEKAIKESKQESNNIDNPSKRIEENIDDDKNSFAINKSLDDEKISKPISENTSNRTNFAKKLTIRDKDSDSIPDQHPIKNENKEQTSDTNGNVLKRPLTTVKKSQRGTKRTRRAATPTERTTKGGRRSKGSRSQTNQNTLEESGGNTHTFKGHSEVNLSKPVKPRLPPARTTLNEMKRRVSAILEFISRTQWELSQDQQTKEELIKFVENEEFVKKVTDVYNRHNETLTMMDDLTRQLLLWEQKYCFNTIKVNKEEEEED